MLLTFVVGLLVALFVARCWAACFVPRFIFASFWAPDRIFGGTLRVHICCCVVVVDVNYEPGELGVERDKAKKKKR